MSTRIEQEGENYLVIFSEDQTDIITVVLPRSIPLRDLEKRALACLSFDFIRLRKTQKAAQEEVAVAPSSAEPVRKVPNS